MAHPARRAADATARTAALHRSIAICAGLQLLAFSLPWLRALLALGETPAGVLGWADLATALCWGAAEVYVGAAGRRAPTVC